MGKLNIYKYVEEFFDEIIYRDDKFVPIPLFRITDVFNDWFEYTFHNSFILNNEEMYRYLRKHYWQNMLKIDNEVFLFNHDFAIHNFN